MGRIKVLAPEYFKNFECIGSKCEDTCCKGWNISIDKYTYKKYKNLKKSDFYPLENKNIILNKEKQGPYDYAKIKLNSEKKCPFLNDNLLCNIYINLGDNYMPTTCKIYPRYINKVDGEKEFSLALSCPEAARKALLLNEQMAFEYIELEYDDYMGLNSNLITTKSENLSRNEYREFWNIRIASIRLLQNRKFDIVSRFILLGMIYNKIQKCIDEQNYDNIYDEISDFINKVENNIDTDIFSNLEKDTMIQTYMSKGMISKYTIGRNFSEKLLYYINNAMSILEVEEDRQTNVINFSILLSNEVISEYQSILNEKVNPFLKEEGMNIIENYLVNEYFREMMPFGRFETIHDSLILLCSNYAMIKTLLSGEAKLNKELTKEKLVEVIYLISRGFMHNKSYFDFILRNIKNLEMDTLGGLYTIIFS